MNKIFALLSVLLAITINPAFSQDTLVDRDTTTTLPEIPYEGFRNMAFSLKYGDLQLDPSPERNIVYGVIIDWHLEENIATIVALLTGDASIYIKSGQVYMGGFSHEEISEPARKLVIASQVLMDKADIYADNSFPEKHSVKFYLLSNRGTFMHQEKEEALNDPGNDWAYIFKLCNDIITAYFKLSDEEKK